MKSTSVCTRQAMSFSTTTSRRIPPRAAENPPSRSRAGSPHSWLKL